MEKYKEAGVDVVKTDNLVKEISGLVDNIGGFGGLYDLGDKYLVGSTDGVGTKILLAKEYDKLDGLGIDCVAMCVNDIICTGARPLFFLDYYASDNVNKKDYLKVLNSIKRGCNIAKIPLIGGETAELPSLVTENHFDIAGFSVGMVDKDKVINGGNIKKGDYVIGIKSDGFHSNGFSLIRKIFDKRKHEKYIDEILKPTRIYVDLMLDILDKFEVKGIAHITGGGKSNLNRILPKGLNVNWVHDEYMKLIRPNIFNVFQKDGDLSDEEMNTVFNNGMGMCFVVEKELEDVLLRNNDNDDLFLAGKII